MTTAIMSLSEKSSVPETCSLSFPIKADMYQKARRFRELLQGERHFVLMEAHNGLSAKIVENAGFPAIWASGLAITASLGVRDNNEISHTQLIDTLEFMNDACNIPILVDGDTGYGNFNNARMFIHKLESHGIAAVCLEDKRFPKMNSFLEDKLDALAPLDEFVGKIKAVKDAQHSPDFTVIARLEALIVNAGIGEALKRAHAYLEAGADGILVHSKRSDARDVYKFLAEFDTDTPIFLVPTKYYSEPVTKLTRDPRVRGLIWANQNIRACLERMRQVCARIYADGTIAGVEDSIATVADVFQIQGNDEYMQAERKYLPAKEEVKAFVMAAGSPIGIDINIPKAMISINGRTILDRQTTAFRANGITDITVVIGYKHDKIVPGDFKMLFNRQWNKSTVVQSMALGLAGETHTPCVVAFGDVIFKRYLLRELIEHDSGDLVLACVKENYIRNNYALKTNNPVTHFDESAPLCLVDVLHGNNHLDSSHTVYFSGLMLVRNTALIISALAETKKKKNGSMEEFFRCLLKQAADVEIVFTSTDSIVDVNSAQDMLTASEMD